MFSKSFLPALVAIATLVGLNLPASAQPATTLRNPLIPGVPNSPPGMPPIEGQPPAVGDGATPAPVHPGMGGNPELMPWVPFIPGNQIDYGSSFVPLPVGPGDELPPGVLGPSLTGMVPHAPSTPGMDPGQLQAPPGFANPADLVNIFPMGGLPGTGGYNTTINKIRRGGQETHQWGFRGRNSIVGGGGDSQDIITEFGQLAGWGMPFGVPSGNGYNKGPAGTNDDLRHSDIDLGGGQRFKVGGVVIPTGSSIQDFGLSGTRDNPFIQAHQNTEFGQGLRRTGVFSNKTTDFGFPYAQFIPANVNPQKTDHLFLPSAVETNF